MFRELFGFVNWIQAVARVPGMEHLHLCISDSESPFPLGTPHLWRVGRVAYLTGSLRREFSADSSEVAFETKPHLSLYSTIESGWPSETISLRRISKGYILGSVICGWRLVRVL